MKEQHQVIDVPYQAKKGFQRTFFTISDILIMKRTVKTEMKYSIATFVENLKQIPHSKSSVMKTDRFDTNYSTNCIHANKFCI